MDNSAFKILLVDDEPDIVEFLGYNLKKEGYTILTASNGKDAIEIARKECNNKIAPRKSKTGKTRRRKALL